jgi:hypothetical protein
MRIKHLPERFYEYHQLKVIKEDLKKLEEFKYCDLELCEIPIKWEFNLPVKEWVHKENYTYHGKMKLYGIYKNNYNNEITILATKTKTRMNKMTYNRVINEKDPYGEEDWEN